MIKTVAIIAIAHLINLSMDQTNYLVINGFDKISKVLENHNLTYEDAEQLEFNDAFIFEIGKKVMMVSNEGLVAIVFSERKIFEKMLAEENFPVADPPSIFCEERPFVKELGKSINQYVYRLRSLGVDSFPSKDRHEASLEELSIQINLIGKENIGRAEFVAIGIYLGEMIRIEKGGKWKLEKKYAINPYYIPVLEYRNGSTSPLWRYLDEHWKKRKKISLNSLKKDILQFYDE